MLANVLYHVSKVFWLFHFAECTLTGVVYLDMFDGFLLPIFIEEDPNGMQLQQDGALPNLNIAVRAGPTACNRSAKAALSLHRHPPLTLHQLISSCSR